MTKLWHCNYWNNGKLYTAYFTISDVEDTRKKALKIIGKCMCGIVKGGIDD